jgi:hypothetical protein
MWDTLTCLLTCDIFDQTRVQQREENVQYRQWNLLWHHVKVNEPYSLSKYTLREEGCQWPIKCQGHVSFNDMWHFNTSPHVWQLWPNTCSTSRGKGSSSSKKPFLIPCKSPWALLSKNALRNEMCPWLIKCPGHVSLADEEHFNKTLTDFFSLIIRFDLDRFRNTPPMSF